MSMDFFRDRKRSLFTIIIFGAIIFTFVLWGGFQSGGSSELNLTTVNGEPITYKEFRQQLSRKLEEFGQLFGRGKPLNDELVQLVEKQIVSNLVTRKVVAQKGREMGIHVGKDEILATLKKMTAFQDPKLKRFSPRIYKAVLEANNLRPASFEKSIKEDILVTRTLDLLESSIQVSEPEMLEAYQVETIKIDLDVATIDSADLVRSGKIRVTEQMIKEHYEKRKGEYLSPEKRKAVIATFDISNLSKQIQVTDAEINKYFEDKVKGSKDGRWTTKQAHALHILVSDSGRSGRNKANELKAKITSEESFKKIAVAHSEDYSNAGKGGDLGYFDEKAMVKPFAEAVFDKAKMNSVYGPVKSDFGYHLIWLKDRTSEAKTLSNRKNQIAYTLKQEKAEMALSELRSKLKDTISSKADKDVRSFLNQSGFKIEETDAFGSKTRLDNVPFVVLQKALKAPIKKWQEPMELSDKIYAFRVTETVTPQQLSLEEAKASIKTRIQQEETEKLAKSLAEKLRMKEIKWTSLKSQGAKVKSHKDIAPFQLTEIPDLGQSEILIRAVQELSSSKPFSNPIIHQGKWVIFQGRSFKKIPGKLSGEARERLKESLASSKRGQILDGFIRKLIEEATIPADFRTKYKI